MAAGERTAEVPTPTDVNESIDPGGPGDLGQEAEEAPSAVSSAALYEAIVDLHRMGRELRIRSSITGNPEYDEMGQRAIPIAGLFRTLLTERRDDPAAVHYLQLLREQEVRVPAEGGRQVPLH